MSSLPLLEALPKAKRMTPTQLAEFMMTDLVDGYGVTGALPIDDWLDFDIVSIWDYGPIGMPGRARRHPTFDLAVVEVEGEDPVFILPGRSKAQYDRVQGVLSAHRDRRRGGVFAPRSGTWRMLTAEGGLVVLSIYVTPAQADPQALHLRATRMVVDSETA